MHVHVHDNSNDNGISRREIRLCTNIYKKKTFHAATMGKRFINNTMHICMVLLIYIYIYIYMCTCRTASKYCTCCMCTVHFNFY
jgi:hypothetical protein